MMGKSTGLSEPFHNPLLTDRRRQSPVGVANRPTWPGSAGLHAHLLESRRGCRRGDELDQCLCRVNLLRSNQDAAGENGHLLDVRRQRTDIVDAGSGYQLAHLLKADLSFATGDEACNEHPGWSLLELRLDLVGDAHALEHADDIVAARSGGIAD